jgi:uracil-DNA glycosylase family 4
MLFGEALGGEEEAVGANFVGPAGKVLTRLITRADHPITGEMLRREDFPIGNIVWCRPPGNELTGAPYEFAAIEHCRKYVMEALENYQPRVVMTLGNQPLRWFTQAWGVEKLRGHIFTPPGMPIVVAGLHPSYIMRGKWNLAKVWQLDLQKAIRVAAEGIPKAVYDYDLFPSPMDAQAYLAAFFRNPSELAFDIETLYAGFDKDDALGSEPVLEDDKSYTITRISFSAKPFGAISMPWIPPYKGIATALLASPVPKIGWNCRAFDCPRLAANGAPVLGRIYDGMEAFHFLEPSIPMGLKSVATYYCPDVEAWHLSKNEEPERYNAIDSDVARRCFFRIRERLQQQGRWETFERHFVDLGLVLDSVSAWGVNVDREKRKQKLGAFSRWLRMETSRLQPLVPPGVRDVTEYKLPKRRLVEQMKTGEWVSSELEVELKEGYEIVDGEMRKKPKEKKPRKKREKKGKGEQ